MPTNFIHFSGEIFFPPYTQCQIKIQVRPVVRKDGGPANRSCQRMKMVWLEAEFKSSFYQHNFFSLYLISTLILYGSSSSKIGNIIHNYFKTFISNSKWSFILYLPLIYVFFSSRWLKCKVQLVLTLSTMDRSFT